MDNARSKDLVRLTRTDFVRFAGAGGDFNPLHHDDEFARSAGFPSVIAMGMLTASLASTLLTDWVGPANLRSLDIRFRAMVFPGDELRVRGEVIDRWQDAGTDMARINFEVVDGDAVVKLSGVSEVVLAAAA